MRPAAAVASSSSSLLLLVNAPPQLAAAQRGIIGLETQGHMRQKDIKICDLTASKDSVPADLFALELQRRAARMQKLVVKAPYVGGALICEVIEEVRKDARELEEAMKRRGDELPEEFREKLAEQIEKARDDCIQVLRDADLM